MFLQATKLWEKTSQFHKDNSPTRAVHQIDRDWPVPPASSPWYPRDFTVIFSPQWGWRGLVKVPHNPKLHCWPWPPSCAPAASAHGFFRGIDTIEKGTIQWGCWTKGMGLLILLEWEIKRKHLGDEGMLWDAAKLSGNSVWSGSGENSTWNIDMWLL